MYPVLSQQASRLPMPFSATYLCEAGFSLAVVNKAKAPRKLESKNHLAAPFYHLFSHQDVDTPRT